MESASQNTLSHLAWDAATSLAALVSQLTLQGPSVPQGDTAHENRKTEAPLTAPPLLADPLMFWL